MPDTNDGAAAPVTDTAAPTPIDESNPMPGFAEAMTAMAGRPDQEAGQPEPAKAVETSAPERVAAAEPEKAEPAKAPPPEKEAESPKVAPTVNFDGLSTESKTYWDSALKAGHATPEDVDRARKESLTLQAWSRNNNEKSNKIKALEAEISGHKADLDFLAKVRGDAALHEKWLAFMRGDGQSASADADAGDLVDSRKAKQIAEQEYEARERAKQAKAAAEQGAYDTKYAALKSVVGDLMKVHSIAPAVMKGYLDAESAAIEGDPVTSVSPEDWSHRLIERHEKAVLAAKVASLEAQLNQRASKQVGASKQSLPPPSRVAVARSSDPWEQTKADLGIADLSNVQGFGLQNGARR